MKRSARVAHLHGSGGGGAGGRRRRRISWASGRNRWHPDKPAQFHAGRGGRRSRYHVLDEGPDQGDARAPPLSFGANSSSQGRLRRPPARDRSSGRNRGAREPALDPRLGPADHRPRRRGGFLARTAGWSEAETLAIAARHRTAKGRSCRSCMRPGAFGQHPPDAIPVIAEALNLAGPRSTASSPSTTISATPPPAGTW